MKMEPLQEDTEGYFFDVCTGLWEDVSKQPAVRYYTACYMLKGPNSAVEIQSIFPGFAGLYLPLYIPCVPTILLAR